jgi:hypothetical protein
MDSLTRLKVSEPPPRYALPRWTKEEPPGQMVSDFVRVKPDVDFSA